VSAAARFTPDEPPLCVDLDGTLIVGDTLAISARLLARRAPWALAGAVLAIVYGRAAFKAAMARVVIPDPASLPWRVEVTSFVREQKAAGRRVFLATAAHRKVAEAVAGYLGCFDGIVATDGRANAKGAGKLAAIRRALGDGPFDYVGDHRADLPVLQAARKGYLVAPNAALRKAASRVARIERVFEPG
jgi:phosphoserine phosphatase